MVMLAKFLLMKLAGQPKIVVVTDRKELDKQIAQTFAHTRLKPARATSGRHLITLINSDAVDVVTAIINKFNTVENSGLKIIRAIYLYSLMKAIEAIMVPWQLKCALSSPMLAI